MVRDVQGLTYSIDKFVYCDPDPDICILKINDTRLPALKLGDSSAVKVGQVVYTIGSPQGYDFSFSNGLISGLRNYDGNKWLQFTAPISSGNSGGPLLNKEGQAIGVISWQAAKGQNLNFALAINAVKPIFKKYYAFEMDKAKGLAAGKDYYVMQADQAYYTNEIDQAIEFYRQAVSTEPDSLELNLKLAEALASRNSQDGLNNAVDILVSLLAENGQDYDLNHRLGTYYFRLAENFGNKQHYFSAINYFEKVIRINPDDAETYARLGAACEKVSRYQDAQTSYRQAANIYRREDKRDESYSARKRAEELYWKRFGKLWLFMAACIAIAFILLPKGRLSLLVLSSVILLFTKYWPIVMFIVLPIAITAYFIYRETRQQV